MKNLMSILFLITLLAMQSITYADVTIDLTQRQDVILEWDLPTTNTNGNALTDLKSIVIEKSIDGSKFAIIATLSATTVTYTDGLSLAGEGIHVYQMYAVNNDGIQSDNSNITTAFLVVPVAIHKPMPPTNVRAR